MIRHHLFTQINQINLNQSQNQSDEVREMGKHFGQYDSGMETQTHRLSKGK